MRHCSLLFAALLLITGCGGSPPSRTGPTPSETYRGSAPLPLSAEIVTTMDRELSVRLPVGWTHTLDEANAPQILLWMVRDDYGATITFSPMTMDPSVYQRLRGDGLLAVAKASLSLKRQAAYDSVQVERTPELFSIGSRAFASYEYSISGGSILVRVVVFDTGSRFMECVAMPASTSMSRQEQIRLFQLQQSVLTSLDVG